jgi:hypothetical protein
LETPAPASPRCPAHQQAAVATCTRCGTFLCGECTELLGEAAWCASCVDFLRKHGPSSGGVRAALGLDLAGLLSLPLCVFLARFGLSPVSFEHGVPLLLPVFNLLVFGLGLGLSARELRRIRAGEASLQGRALARWVRGLAWVNLVFFLFFGWLATAFII